MSSPRIVRSASRERAIDAVLWSLTAIAASLTLWLSLGPVPPGANAFPNADKLFHGSAYFVTTLLFLFSAVWRPGRGPGPLARYAPFLVVAILMAGLVVEALQGLLTASRDPEIGDWLGDAVGGMLALAVHEGVRRAVGVRSSASVVTEDRS